MKYTEEEHDWETQYHISSIEWEKHIKKLKTETATLRERLAIMTINWQASCDQICDLEAEKARLRAERDEAKEDWLREFEKRGHEVAAVERQKAIVVSALMRLRDESDQLCPTQIKHIAVNALDNARIALNEHKAPAMRSKALEDNQ